MDNPRRHPAKWNRPVLEDHVLRAVTHESPEQSNQRDKVERRLPGWRGLEAGVGWAPSFCWGGGRISGAGWWR